MFQYPTRPHGKRLFHVNRFIDSSEFFLPHPSHAGAARRLRAGPASRPSPALRVGCRVPPCALLRYRCTSSSRSKTCRRSSTTCSSTGTTSTSCTTSRKGQVSKQRYLPRPRSSALLLLTLQPLRALFLVSQWQRLNVCFRLLLPGCHAGCFVLAAAAGADV